MTTDSMEEVAAMRDYAVEAIGLLRRVAAHEHVLESELGSGLASDIRRLLRNVDGGLKSQQRRIANAYCPVCGSLWQQQWGRDERGWTYTCSLRHTWAKVRD